MLRRNLLLSSCFRMFPSFVFPLPPFELQAKKTKHGHWAKKERRTEKKITSKLEASKKRWSKKSANKHRRKSFSQLKSFVAILFLSGFLWVCVCLDDATKCYCCYCLQFDCSIMFFITCSEGGRLCRSRTRIYMLISISIWCWVFNTFILLLYVYISLVLSLFGPCFFVHCLDGCAINLMLLSNHRL